tara:strand:- start:306 stop:872 length:567 start_codon:yes stop_codon:yes gene_type:complete
LNKSLSSLNCFPSWEEFHTIIFDFDGIFTNNKVLVDENGEEIVICDRSDGLAFDILRKFIELKKWDVEFFVLSTEVNDVVKKRCQKLKIKCHHGIKNKKLFIVSYLKDRFGEDDFSRKGLIYLGNDINDLSSMEYAGFSVAPKDSHHIIRETADIILDVKGGDGFVRCFIEKLLKINYEVIKKYSLFD